MTLRTFGVNDKSLNPSIINGFQAFSPLQLSKTGFLHIFTILSIVFTRPLLIANFLPGHVNLLIYCWFLPHTMHA